MPPKESWLSPKIEIREADIKGRGMFAREHITAGETILVYGGEFVDAATAKKALAEGKLAMQWDEHLWSVEDRGDDSTYFLNHSCNPNAWMKDTWTIVARRDVDVGEEITADYAMWEADEDYISKWDCKCGSANCRHQVTGKDWRKSELQDAYGNHFIPMINKRISELQQSI